MKKFLTLVLLLACTCGVFLIPAQAGETISNQKIHLVVGKQYTLKIRHILLFEPKVVVFLRYDENGNPVFQDWIGNEITVKWRVLGAPEIKEYKPAE